VKGVLFSTLGGLRGKVGGAFEDNEGGILG